MIKREIMVYVREVIHSLREHNLKELSFTELNKLTENPKVAGMAYSVLHGNTTDADVIWHRSIWE